MLVFIRTHGRITCPNSIAKKRDGTESVQLINSKEAYNNNELRFNNGYRFAAHMWSIYYGVLNIIIMAVVWHLSPGAKAGDLGVVYKKFPPVITLQHLIEGVN